MARRPDNPVEEDRQATGYPAPLDITDAEFARVRELALRLTGISIAVSKKTLIVGRWGPRLTRYGLTRFSDYLALLSGNQAPGELQISLDLLTTNETSFFREPKHFEFLRKEVLSGVKHGSRFRVWSAACSSGEEPYTLAMVLAAEPRNLDWDVLGTDLSTRVLETARAGLYDLPRAEGIPKDYLRRFCLRGTGPHAGKFMIERALRDRVQFSSANLNEPMANFGQFDVIMLRNVMIYFDARTKERVVKHLVPSIKPGGYLIIGHCDTLAGVAHSLSMCSSSIYRKQST